MADVKIQAVDTAPDGSALRREYLARLRETIEGCFNKGELRAFCDDLGVKYDSLPGEGTAEKARELVAYLERRGRIRELVKEGQRQRPHATWEYMAASPGKLLGRIKRTQETSESPAIAPTEELTLERVMATVSNLQDKWPTADLSAVHTWLSTTKGQLQQVDKISNELTSRLKRWIDRYRQASKITQDCIYFQSWLSLRMDLGEENWPALAMEINLVFSPIRSGYASHAADIEGTHILTPKEADILRTLTQLKETVDKIEASRSELRRGRDSAKCRQEFEQIQISADAMADYSIQLCQCMHAAIKEMVGKMNEPIETLKKL